MKDGSNTSRFNFFSPAQNVALVPHSLLKEFWFAVQGHGHPKCAFGLLWGHIVRAPTAFALFCNEVFQSCTIFVLFVVSLLWVLATTVGVPTALLIFGP